MPSAPERAPDPWILCPRKDSLPGAKLRRVSWSKGGDRLPDEPVLEVTMDRFHFLAPLLGLCALFGASGCNRVSMLPAETADGEPPFEEYAENAEYVGVMDQVAAMVSHPGIRERVGARGLSIVDVTWEDTGRAVGSSLGPNISDLTLQVRRRDPNGQFTDALMPVIRVPNFTDRTGDVPADRFFVRVGNERGAGLETLPLAELLRDLGRFASSPATLTGRRPAGAALDLSAPRDTHYLVSAQAVFLPIPRTGKAVFNPVLFNYQSAPQSPAVLTILATREGTSMAVIENRTEDRTIQGWGQELYFNDAGQRAAFTAERRSDVSARIEAQGGPRSEADRSALGKGADVLAIVQVPLIHSNRGMLGGAFPQSGYGYEFTDDPLAAGGFGPNDATIRVRPGPVRVGSTMERAVLGHGPHLGPFSEGYGAWLVRDPKFPIRITIQFYKATSDGVVTDEDLDAIEKNIESAYEHADFVGSLVVPPGDPRRPTAWQSIPQEWFPW